MRKPLIGGAVLAALTFAAPAAAGCWATAGLASPPEGTAAGEVWPAKITVLQHGRNPLPDASDATPKVAIVNSATGAKQTFAAKASDPWPRPPSPTSFGGAGNAPRQRPRRAA